MKAQVIKVVRENSPDEAMKKLVVEIDSYTKKYKRKIKSASHTLTYTDFDKKWTASVLFFEVGK
ncbi:MAG TPA: hypothetical protein VK806_10340 [Bacteroidia bacterium]|jgi:hypothetical protein|nr:hypothetical protein [Bacteroidia bacterium]